MDKSIKAGDLVMVIAPRRCGCDSTIGNIFRVKDVVSDMRGGRCITCNKTTFPPRTPTAVDDQGYSYELSRLKRIDPLREPESIVERDTVKA